MFGNQLDSMDALMKRTYLDSYYHTAFELQKGVGVGWDIAGVNTKALETIIRTPWATDGHNFSERIWANKTALIGELQKQLTQNLMLGKAPDESIAAISAKLNVSQSQAARLVYTEGAYFQMASQGDCFNALGVKKFQFIATLDDRTSDICRDMDGKVFDMKEYAVGVNVPPLHPWCRSCTAPYYDDLDGIGERAARDPDTGQTYYVPRDMKYHDWEKTFVKAGTSTPTGNSYGVNYACSLAQIFGHSYYDAIHQMVVDCPDSDLANLWQKYESQIQVGDANANGREYCSGSSIFVNGKRDAKGSSWEAPYQVTFHESGHAIDYLASSNATGFTSHFSSRYQNGAFPQLIKQEVDELVSALGQKMKPEFKAHSGDYDWLHQHGYISDSSYNWYQKYGNWLGGTPTYSKSMAYGALEKEIKALQPLAKARLSDILEGATNGKISVGFGHGKSYWSKRTYNGVSDGLATESFAEMVDCTMTCPEGLESIKKYLPKAYGMFKQMVKTLLP